MITIREYKEEDFNSYYALFCDIIAERNFFSLEKPYDIQSSMQFRQTQKNANFPMGVAYDGNKFIGWCDIFNNSSEHNPKFGIGIAPEYRDKGIGKQMHKYIFTRCKECGIDTLYLNVFADNTRAKALYKKLGFMHLASCDIIKKHFDIDRVLETHKLEL